MIAQRRVLFVNERLGRLGVSSVRVNGPRIHVAFDAATRADERRFEPLLILEMQLIEVRRARELRAGQTERQT